MSVRLKTLWVIALDEQRDALLINTHSSYDRQRVIGPLHTAGPVGLTPDGTRVITCVGEQVVLTDIQSGRGLCRFAGVRLILCGTLTTHSP
jgi:hypothetical protein